MIKQSKKESGHEARDANGPALACFGLALAGGIGVVLLFSAALFARFDEQRPTGTSPSRITVLQIAPPGPTLQTNPTLDFDRFHEQEEATLHSYSWIDKAGGVVRIPVDRAMNLIVQRGLPANQTVPKRPLEMRQEKAGEKSTP